jgi:teichuronic acid exporter
MSDKSRIIFSFVWKLSERFSAQIIQFVIQIILARLLFPEDFGLISIISVFTTFANAIINGGFSSAIIRTKNITNEDVSAVFYFNIALSILLYIVLFSIAPLIARFYELNILTSLIRVVGINIILGSISSIQISILSRNLEFKKIFICNFIAMLISGTISIWIAFEGVGVWALVFQQIIFQFILNILIIFLTKWRPSIKPSYSRFKEMYKFGWKIQIGLIVEVIYTDINNLLVAKYFSSRDLGFYTKGNQFPYLFMSNINGAIKTVMFPVFSKSFNEQQKIKYMIRRSIVTSTYVLTPILFGLILLSEPIVMILLTDKWEKSIILIQILALGYIFWPIHTSNLQALNAIGRSDIYLKQKILKTVIALLGLFIALNFSIYYVAISFVITNFISVFLIMLPNKKIFDYGLRSQLKDIFPSIIISLVMYIVLQFIIKSVNNYYLQIIISVPLGILIYWSLSEIFKYEPYLYIKNSILDGIKSINK